VTKPSNPAPITNHHSPSSPGGRLRTAIEEERPLQMVGAINAFCALLAKLARAGAASCHIEYQVQAAAEDVYRAIRQDGTQKAMIGSMQTREDLYQILNYHEYESKLDSFSKG
jgi:2-methylisocitrate lyase-like PEP mutase family enzyme